MVEDWQRCEKTHHVGDDRDPTVTWRDLGLTCDTCYAAIGDRRSLQALLDAERQRAEEAERERDKLHADGIRLAHEHSAAEAKLAIVRARLLLATEALKEIEREHPHTYFEARKLALRALRAIEGEYEQYVVRDAKGRFSGLTHATKSVYTSEGEEEQDSKKHELDGPLAEHDFLSALEAAGYKRYARTLRDALAAIEAWSEGSD